MPHTVRLHRVLATTPEKVFRATVHDFFKPSTRMSLVVG